VREGLLHPGVKGRAKKRKRCPNDNVIPRIYCLCGRQIQGVGIVPCPGWPAIGRAAASAAGPFLYIDAIKATAP
jgi:hypothetical protein